MAIISEEKRLFPRIKTNLKVSIFEDILADSIDLSERGLSFNTQETITSPLISLRINFPDSRVELKTSAKLIWKRDLESGGSLFGVEFMALDEMQKEALRRELIKTQICQLLSNIKSHEVRSQISHFFLKDILGYISEITKLVPHLSKKEYSFELEKKIEHLNNQILLKGYCLDLLLSNKTIIQRVKDNFRQLIGVWVYKSMIVKHAFDKPRGYPGDYRMQEIIYNNMPISKGIGTYFDSNFLKSPYAVAVRLRKDRIRQLLQRFITEARLARIHILNVGCGPCREIRELLLKLKVKKSVYFTCVDWDEQALEFSQDIFSCRPQKNIEFKFIKQDVMNIIKKESFAQSCDRQNLIYSTGLIDYLPDRILKRLIQSLYQLLQAGGQLILTHKNRDKTFPPILPDWFCDWRFVPRNKDEIVKLFYNCGVPGSSLCLESDDFGYIYYFTLIKR